MKAEQIQLIKDWYKDPTTTKKEKVLLEKLYPELKESEDEKIRKGLEYFLWCIANGRMNDRGTMPSAAKCQKWLAYLEKQKIPEGSPTPDLTTMLVPNRYNEQKPAEWSEEDETFVKDAIEAVENYYSKGCGQEELVAWLKSLRPRLRWKPSEEQMEWLESAVRLSIGKPRTHGVIVSLYEQLKRL